MNSCKKYTNSIIFNTENKSIITITFSMKTKRIFKK